MPAPEAVASGWQVGLEQRLDRVRLVEIGGQRLGDVMDAPREPHDIVPTREGFGPGRVEVIDLARSEMEVKQGLPTGILMGMEGGGLGELTDEQLQQQRRATDHVGVEPDRAPDPR